MLSGEKWSLCEFATFVRSYLFNKRFPDAHAIHKIPQFSQEEVERECRAWLFRFVQKHVQEYRWQEIADHLWGWMLDRPWEWEQRAFIAAGGRTDNWLDDAVNDYIKKYPRRYRTIDEE